MTVTVLNIIPAKSILAAQTGQYTANAVKTVIDKFTVTNESAVAQSFNVHLVPSLGTATASNRIIYERDIGAGECYTCPELVGHVLEAGGFISTSASNDNVLTIRASGREIS